MVSPKDIVQTHQEWCSTVAAGGSRAAQATDGALRKCKDALGIMSEELARLKYPVRSVLVASSDNVDELVASIKRGTSFSVPEILVCFWKIVGGVSFVDLKHYRHVDFWDEAGVRAEFCDGIHVDACTPGWADYIVNDFNERRDDGDDFDPDLYGFDLAPDGYHKDNISGGMPHGVRPGNAWLPTWDNFWWAGQRRPTSAPSDPPDFFGYLRTAILECAGFPGLFGDDAFEPLRVQILNRVELF